MTERRRVEVWLLTAFLCAVVMACGRGAGAGKLIELQRVRSGMLDVVLLSPTAGLQHGKDTFAIEFKSASGGTLVDVGNVKAAATMAMAGMPMLGGIDVKKTDVAGRYEAIAGLSMAGTWRLTFQWDGPAGQGSVSFSTAVQ